VYYAINKKKRSRVMRYFETEKAVWSPSDNVREFLKEKGYTTKTLAENLSVSVSVARRILNGNAELFVRDILALCNFLNISLDELTEYRPAVSKAEAKPYERVDRNQEFSKLLNSLPPEYMKRAQIGIYMLLQGATLDEVIAAD
jgi:transcriptional regulator with XRE-family HTH domain